MKISNIRVKDSQVSDSTIDLKPQTAVQTQMTQSEQMLNLAAANRRSEIRKMFRVTQHDQSRYPTKQSPHDVGSPPSRKSQGKAILIER